MTARPIIFRAAMIRALLDGQKTQTRRIVKPRDGLDALAMHQFGRCPYGQPGDLLWARETFCTDVIRALDLPQIIYAADYYGQERPHIRWRPSIHMPRWASRLTLRITDVRVQRLQEISEADARAEGCSARPFPGPWWQGYRELNGALVHEQAIGDQPPDWMIEPKRMADTPHLDLTAVDDFRSVWHSIHGPDSWSANPWVWALTFDVIHKNIDEVVDDD